jgi:non-ribosomal peptide synthetase component F
MFVLQDFPHSALEIPGLTLSPLDLQVYTAPFALSLMMARTGDGIAGRFIYAADLFDDTTVIQLAGHFLALLEQVADDPDRKVTSLGLIHPTESQMVGAFNDDF